MPWSYLLCLTQFIPQWNSWTEETANNFNRRHGLSGPLLQRSWIYGLDLKLLMLHLLKPKVLRSLLDTPLYFSNLTLDQEVHLLTVRDEIGLRFQKFYSKLSFHPNRATKIHATYPHLILPGAWIDSGTENSWITECHIMPNVLLSHQYNQNQVFLSSSKCEVIILSQLL